MHDRSLSKKIQSCEHCQISRTGWFCHLSPEPLAEFNSIASPLFLPRGSILFSEGQASRYVANLCIGRLKMTKSSSKGKTLLLKVAQPGEVLGLSATLAEGPYETTIQAIEHSHVKMIERTDFLHFIQRHGEGGLHAAESLNRQYISTLNDACRLALSNTIVGRLACLLLEYTDAPSRAATESSEIHMPLKHEELASMLGSSRESVTRALNDLRRQGVISIKGTKLTVLRKQALELLL